MGFVSVKIGKGILIKRKSWRKDMAMRRARRERGVDLNEV